MKPNAAAAPAPRPPRAWARRLRIAVAVVLVLVLAWTAAWLYVPPILQKVAEDTVRQRLGRSLFIGHIDFNPWTLELTVEEVALGGSPAGAPDQLRIGRMHVNAAISSLWRLAPVIDAIEIDNPEVRLTRLEDGRYDIDDVWQRIAAMPPSPEPARFALHNIVVRSGAIDFVDRPVKATHRVRDITLGIPFLSTLPSEREIKVEPHLAFTIGGSRFDSAAAATPWYDRGQGVAQMQIERVDIAPYLDYLPPGLAARPRAGSVSAALRLAFERHPRASVRLAGTLQLDGIEVVDAASKELLRVGSVRIAIDELRPLERIVRLGRVDVDALRVLGVRDADGHVNLLLGAGDASTPAKPVARIPMPTTAASAARAASAAAAPTGPSPAASGAGPAWTATLAALSVRAGRLDWRDATLTPAAALALTDFTLDAQAIAWPLDAPVVFRGGATLGNDTTQGRVSFVGQGKDTGASAQVNLDSLSLALAEPYLQGLTVPPLAGELSADIGVSWKPAPDAAAVTVDVKRLAIAGWRVGTAAAPLLAAERLEVADAHVDTAARSASIGRFGLAAPRVRLARTTAGRWSFEDAIAPAAAPSATSAAPMASARSRPPAASGADPGRRREATWKVALGELALDKGTFHLNDARPPEPVVFDLVDVGLHVKGWALNTSAPAPFQFVARVGAPPAVASTPAASAPQARGARPARAKAPVARTEAPTAGTGRIELRGELRGIADGRPGAAQAHVVLADMPLHVLDQYLGSWIDLDVQKAQGGFTGDLSWERRGTSDSVHLRGDATVDDFRAVRATAEAASGTTPTGGLRGVGSTRPLLNWKTLSLRGVDVALEPDAPLRVAIAETALSDFYARVVLDENGRLNLADITRGAGEAPAAADGAASAPAASGTAVAASAPAASKAPAAASAPAVATPAAAGPPSSATTGSASSPVFDIGPIAVANGRIDYNDRFVKPSYSAALSELNGRLGAFSSRAPSGGAPQLAQLELRGRAQGTATLEITGLVNPLAKPLALDVKAQVRDLELPPLSPYAIKYAGYGIERGKLSADLAYVVKPDGQLSATNKVVLNQLAFGEKDPAATSSLPVKLAVALLADSHGVIDVDLPVSGSINDPQFSIGGVVWKAIGNLVLKAVTAPFTLLASAFKGGGSAEDLSTVAFAPGTSTLTAPEKERLDKLAKAMLERPAVNLTVTGEARLDTERDAWKRERLAQMVRAEKRRRAIAGGAPPGAEITVTEAEYAELLKQVYARAEIEKPKNVIGIAKDIPTTEMETLLLASIPVGEEAMSQLAVRRAVVVRDYLATREVPTSRLFLGAPKAAPTVDDAAWKPRADLKLAAD